MALGFLILPWSFDKPDKPVREAPVIIRLDAKPRPFADVRAIPIPIEIPDNPVHLLPLEWPGVKVIPAR